MRTKTSASRLRRFSPTTWKGVACQSEVSDLTYLEYVDELKSISMGGIATPFGAANLEELVAVMERMERGI
jgi:hypothetical protein